MITASQIAPYRTASPDYPETERLKNLFRRLRSKRQPFFLTLDEFDQILRWKLRNQYNRQHNRRLANTDEVIRAVTSLALTIMHEDRDYEVELRLNLLCALRGVGISVASAVLALVFPKKYAVIDYRGWRQIFLEKKNGFTINQYKKYLLEIRRLAEELDWDPQEVDLAIWKYDRRHSST